MASASRQTPGLFQVAKSPNEALALSNCVIVNPDDFSEKTKYILVDGRLAFSIK